MLPCGRAVDMMRLVERSSVFQAPRHSRQSIHSYRIKAGSVGNTAAAVGFVRKIRVEIDATWCPQLGAVGEELIEKMASIKRKIDPIQSAHGAPARRSRGWRLPLTVFDQDKGPSTGISRSSLTAPGHKRRTRRQVANKLLLVRHIQHVGTERI